MQTAKNLEIERRFLYENPVKPHGVDGARIRQGYFAIDNGNTVRVRTTDERGAKTASLCLKGPKHGAEAPEFEWDCSLSGAAELFTLCNERIVEKIRHQQMYQGWLFEIDIFKGSLAPLIIVEVELATSNQKIELPGWVGEEITHRGEYSNAALAVDGLPDHFSRWARERRISR